MFERCLVCSQHKYIYIYVCTYDHIAIPGDFIVEINRCLLRVVADAGKVNHVYFYAVPTHSFAVTHRHA